MTRATEMGRPGRERSTAMTVGKPLSASWNAMRSVFDMSAAASGSETARSSAAAKLRKQGLDELRHRTELGEVEIFRHALRERA